MTADTPRTDNISDEIDCRIALTGVITCAEIQDALDHARTLERDLAECRAALAERQAAIDAIVRCDMSHAVMQTSTTLIRLESAIDNARALATKEPQP